MPFESNVNFSWTSQIQKDGKIGKSGQIQKVLQRAAVASVVSCTFEGTKRADEVPKKYLVMY